MKITVSIRDEQIKQFIQKQIADITQLGHEHTKILAEEARKSMVENIEASRKRQGATHNLQNNIQVEEVTDGHGVGNIEQLNREAPYWHWCLAEDTEVYANIEGRIVPVTLDYVFKNNIKQILTPYGLKNINNIWVSKESTGYILNIGNFWSCEATANHKFLVKLNKNILEKTVGSLSDKIISSYHFIYSSLNVFDHIIKEVNINNNIVELTYDLGYLVGFIAGDGYVDTNRTVIAQKTLECGNIWERTVHFCANFNYVPKKYFDNSNYCVWRIQINNKIIQSIFSFFVTGKRTTKRLNNFFLNSPVSFRKGILEGYRFSDGRKSRKNGDNVRTISLELRNQILLLASSLGYDISVTQNQKESSNNIIHQANPLYTGAYYYNSRFHYRNRETKKTKIDEVRDEPVRNKLGRFVSNKRTIEPFFGLPKILKERVKSTKNKVFYDINIDSHLFLINGGIVTHNCNYGIAQSGRRVPPGTDENPVIQGHFDPSENGRFKIGQQPMFRMNPKRPIEAMNYIEKAISHVLTFANQLLKKGKI